MKGTLLPIVEKDADLNKGMPDLGDMYDVKEDDNTADVLQDNIATTDNQNLRYGIPEPDTSKQVDGASESNLPTMNQISSGKHSLSLYLNIFVEYKGMKDTINIHLLRSELKRLIAKQGNMLKYHDDTIFDQGRAIKKHKEETKNEFENVYLNIENLK